jgi:hypothetical protein
VVAFAMANNPLFFLGWVYHCCLGKITFLQFSTQLPLSLRHYQEHPGADSNRTRYAPESHQITFQEDHTIDFQLIKTNLMGS